MSEVLSFSNSLSNFSFTTALVFDIGIPNSRWFRATIGKEWVMVFYPDDNSITRDVIVPGDTIYVAGIVDNPKDGLCNKKANCAPLALQYPGFKRAAEKRVSEAACTTGCPVKRPEPQPTPSPQPSPASVRITLSDADTLDFLQRYVASHRLRGRSAMSQAATAILREACLEAAMV